MDFLPKFKSYSPERICTHKLVIPSFSYCSDTAVQPTNVKVCSLDLFSTASFLTWARDRNGCWNISALLHIPQCLFLLNHYKLPPSRKVTSPNSWHSRRENLSPATASHSTDFRVTMAVDAGWHEEQSFMSLLLTVPSLTISSGCHFSCSAQAAATFPQAHSSAFIWLPWKHHMWGKISLAFQSPEDFQRFCECQAKREEEFSWSTAHVAGDLKVPSHLLIFCLWCVLQSCVGSNPPQDKLYWLHNTEPQNHRAIGSQDQNCSCWRNQTTAAV